MELSKIATEQRNESTLHIDELSTMEMIRLINEEDKKVALAVEKETEKIAKAVDMIVEGLQNGGRLIYVGCGTSGRLGILDAVECPPTYSTNPDLVVGLIAGGERAIFKAVEGAEDRSELGEEDLRDMKITKHDTIVGIAASGRTPYVIGAMKYAKTIGCKVIGVTCYGGSEIDQLADVGIAPMPGPEVVTGSTRMKSGTAQKMVLNMLSTGAMIRMGKVYGNLMVDVKASNEKLVQRCISIVETAAQCSREDAIKALEASEYHAKTAIVMIKKELDVEEAIKLLEQVNGQVLRAVSS
ncbi:MAG: N-acetylmuramic acid 6-phosphate etherase [Eubacteriales bacterium]